MSDLTRAFNAILKAHEVHVDGSYSLDKVDEFLKEAYRIVSQLQSPGLIFA
jgi:hypothetical protein